MPRKSGDFGEEPDKLYDALGIESEKLKARELDDMASEAKKYRQYLESN